MEPSQLSPRYIIPVGTQVVLTEDLRAPDGRFKKEGSVGRVEEAPPTRQGKYLVRFADDATVGARHDQLAVRRTLAPEDALPERNAVAYEPYLIYRAVLGSKATDSPRRTLTMTSAASFCLLPRGTGPCRNCPSRSSSR